MPNYDALLQALNDPRPQPPPPLSPQEQDSLLSGIGSTALHGIGYVGSSLSKAFGGRAIRGLLGGRPEELASIIPFSDAMGITNPANEVHGSDFLGGNKDTSLFSPEGVGGLGIDILTDPATYLSFGGSALTSLGVKAAKAGIKPAGGAARAAGLLAGSPELATMAESAARAGQLGKAAGPVAPKALQAAEASLVGQPLGGHVGLHIPFTDMRTAFDLSGPLAALNKVPGVAATAGAVNKVTEPFRLGFNALFQRGAKGQMNPILQEMALADSAKAPAAVYDELSKLAPIRQELQKLAGWAEGAAPSTAQVATELDLANKFSMAVERLPGPGQTISPANQTLLSTFPKEVIDLAMRQKAILGDSNAARTAAGYTREGIEGFYPRQASQFPAGKGGNRSVQDVAHPEEWQARNKKLFGDMYSRGPQSVNELSLDRPLQALPKDQAEAAILTNYLGWTPQQEARYTALKSSATASLGPAGEARFTELINKVNKTPAEVNEFAQLFSQRQQHLGPAGLQELAGLEKIKTQAGELAGWQKHLDIDSLEKIGGYFGNHPLADMERYLVREASAKQNAATAYAAAAKMALPGPQPGSKDVGEILKEFGLDGSAFQGVHISGPNAKDLTNYIKPSLAPPGAHPFLSAMDSLTNLTKAGQTSWPATIARNFASDVAMRSWQGGDPLAFSLGKTFREGGVIPGIAEKIGFHGASDAEAMQQLAREVFALQLTDSKKYQALQVTSSNPLLGTTSKEMPFIGGAQKGLGESLLGKLPNASDLTAAKLKSPEGKLNPLNVRGVGAKTESSFAPVAIAQTGQQYLEDINRVGSYIDSRIRGFSPVAGRGEVNAMHLDFGNLSGFERNVMTRVFPYYSWLRSNTPQVIRQLSERPGGPMAMTIRAMNSAQGQQPGFFPEDLANTGYGIPVGAADAAGRRNYLTSTGLNFEDLAQLMSGQQMLGSLNPAIRVPIELGFGRQVYSGRDLPVNYPLEAGSTANELLMNSPLSRVFSTARALSGGADRGDMTAPLASLLGAHITNVDVNTAKQMAIRQAAEDMLRNIPEVSKFQRMYVPANQIPNLNADELLAYRLYRSLGQNRQPVSP